MPMRNVALSVVAILVVFWLGACSSAGVGQFQLYSQAFNLQFVQGEAVLDRLGRAERLVMLRNLPSGSFDPNDAAYYVNAGDPPITSSFRQSLKALKAYNEALAALANGETSDALVNRVGTIAANLTGAAGGLEGLPSLSPLENAVTVAKPYFKALARFAARESFRRQLIEGQESMKALLLGLRKATGVMFDLLQRSYTEIDAAEGYSGISSDGTTLLESDRQLLAGWVILLDQNLEAMNVAVLAAMSRASPADLSALAEASVELRVLAEQVKAARAR